MTINKLHIVITTDNANNADTDGTVFLGIGGREFCCDSSADDRERGSTQTYVFGEGANVTRAPANDPRNPSLDAASIDRLPVYLRFESGDDHWAVRRAQLTVNDAAWPGYELLIGDNEAPLWLGPHSGKIVHLTKHNDGLPIRGQMNPGASEVLR